MLAPWRIGFVLAGVVLLAAGGCADKDAFPLVPVSGRITLDGQPLAGASVFFKPQGKTPGFGAHGSTDADGRYVLTAARLNKPGTAIGEYTVAISKRVMPPPRP